jgi:polyferredoxin
MQNLYFPHEGIRILVILAFVVTITVGLAAAILIRKKRLTKNLKILLLLVSLIFGGIILGGVPNVVLIIQNLFAELPLIGAWGSLLMRTSIFLVLTFFFGRIFCGYVCPLGAAQELVSLSRFKSKVNPKMVYQKRTPLIRWGFFLIYAAISIILGFEATLFMNPINGFLYLWTPFNILILAALVGAIATILVGIFVYRPYCRFICPFGALAALFAKFSPLKLRRTEDCNECGLCEKVCPTQEAHAESDMAECYYCYRCIDACRHDAIEYSMR